MKHSIFPLLVALMAGSLLADVAPRGCGKRNSRPPSLPSNESPEAPPAGSEAPGVPDLENKTQPQA